MKILLPLFVLMFAFSAFGQNGQVVTDNTGKKILIKPDGKWEYLIEKPVISESGKNLIADDGSNIANLLMKYRDQMKKSEFETENEYADRIKKFLKSTTNTMSGKPLSETTVILEGTDHYNAETQTFWFNYVEYQINNIDKKQKISFDFVERGRAYWTRFNLWLGNTDLRFKVEPKKASEIKSDLAVAVVGWPVEIDHGYIAVESGPHTISIVPRRYTAFNKKTGEIYITVIESGIIF